MDDSCPAAGGIAQSWLFKCRSADPDQSFCVKNWDMCYFRLAVGTTAKSSCSSFLAVLGTASRGIPKTGMFPRQLSSDVDWVQVHASPAYAIVFGLKTGFLVFLEGAVWRFAEFVRDGACALQTQALVQWNHLVQGLVLVNPSMPCVQWLSTAQLSLAFFHHNWHLFFS